MRVNEIVKMSQLLNNLPSNLNNITSGNVNDDYSKQITKFTNTIQNYNDLGDQVDSLAFANNSLSSSLNTLSKIDTDYTNPVTGEKEISEQTIDTLQTNKLKNQIKSYVNAYNKAFEESQFIDSQTIENQFNSLSVTENLENIGITKNEDGSLNFDESKFNETIVAGKTKLSDIQNTVTDLHTLTMSTSSIINTFRAEIQEEYSNINEQISELQTEFNSDYQSYLENNLNTMLSNTINSLMAGLGVGYNFSSYA